MNAKRFLIDLSSDPGESEKSAGEHPEVVSLLGKKLNIWKHSLPRTDEKLKGARNQD